MPPEPTGPLMAKQRRARKASRPSRRWLQLLVGLALFATALYALATYDDEEPMGQIDAASRARLEQVLEQADREDGR